MPRRDLLFVKYHVHTNPQNCVLNGIENVAKLFKPKEVVYVNVAALLHSLLHPRENLNVIKERSIVLLN